MSKPVIQVSLVVLEELSAKQLVGRKVGQTVAIFTRICTRIRLTIGSRLCCKNLTEKRSQRTSYRLRLVDHQPYARDLLLCNTRG